MKAKLRRVLWFAVLYPGHLNAQFASAQPGLMLTEPHLQTSVQKTAATGSITGIVTDTDGGLIAGAQVRLNASKAHSTVITGKDGRFSFTEVTPADVHLTISATGLATVEESSGIVAGMDSDLGIIVLHASADVTIEVLSPHAAAEIEVKREEHQRALGFAPNFYVAYDFNAPPLDARQKWELNWRTLIDPVNLALLAGQAGLEQETNAYSGFGSGPAGYGKRLGAATADFYIGNSLAGWILPVAFKQDPRYFYRGTGTKRQRFIYAVTRSVIARGDNGKSQPAYANILGSLGAGAISNAYYPAANRQGATLTFVNAGISVGFDAISNVLQEFLLKHISAGVKQP